VGGNIAPEQADILCEGLEPEILVNSLLPLIGIHEEVANRLQVWIQNDIRYFVSQDYDFGMAYAAARIGWKNFNMLAPATADTEISRQGRKWLNQEKELAQDRDRAIYTDSNRRELIESPY